MEQIALMNDVAKDRREEETIVSHVVEVDLLSEDEPSLGVDSGSELELIRLDANQIPNRAVYVDGH